MSRAAREDALNTGPRDYTSGIFEQDLTLAGDRVPVYMAPGGGFAIELREKIIC